MKRTGRTHPFGEIMEEVLPHVDGGRRGQVVLPHVWGQIVGEVFARQSCPNAIVKGVLDVSVSNANWLHELRFMKASIMERLHEMLPGPGARGTVPTLRRISVIGVSGSIS